MMSRELFIETVSNLVREYDLENALGYVYDGILVHRQNARGWALNEVIATAIKLEGDYSGDYSRDYYEGRHGAVESIIKKIEELKKRKDYWVEGELTLHPHK